MTLSAALSSATSSLRAIQTQMAVASSNIANADDVNYAAKIAKQQANVAGGVGIGVDVVAIESKVDFNLVLGIVAATSADHAAQTTQDYIQTLSDSLGNLSNTGAGNALATTLSSLTGHLDELATTPESTTLKNTVATEVSDAAASLRGTAEEVQALRADADSAIADAIPQINDALHQIDALNVAIVRAQAGGKPTADLEDQRNAALQTIAGFIDVKAFTESNGALNVYTGAGQVLVASQVHELSFTESNTVNESTFYPADLGGVMLDGDDISKSIRSGSVAALLTLRDSTLPAVQTQLDAVSNKLRDTLNTISNNGSASPPPHILSGTETFTAADGFSGSGTLRVAVTDPDGKIVSYSDFDLSTFATVGDVVTALNSVGDLAASLDANGHLVLEALTTENGVAVSGGTVDTENFSGFFGLNDVLTGDSAGQLIINPTLASDPKRLPVGTLNMAPTLNSGDIGVSVGSGTLAQSMADAMRSSKVTSDAGNLVSNVAGQLSTAKSRASSTETNLNTLVGTFSSKYGVNVDEETAHITELQNAYAASAQVMSAVKNMFESLLQAVR